MTELINFTELTYADKMRILSWRNDDRIRFNMYSTDIIKESAHLAFIEALKEKSDREYFLVRQDGKPLGCIYFTDITEKNAVMGIYAAPEVKGAGRPLMDALLSYAFNCLKVETVTSEVFADNERASSLYEKYGFTGVSEKTVNGRRVKIMELKNKYENSYL